MTVDEYLEEQGDPSLQDVPLHYIEILRAGTDAIGTTGNPVRLAILLQHWIRDFVSADSAVVQHRMMITLPPSTPVL